MKVTEIGKFPFGKKNETFYSTFVHRSRITGQRICIRQARPDWPEPSWKQPNKPFARGARRIAESCVQNRGRIAEKLEKPKSCRSIFENSRQIRQTGQNRKPTIFNVQPVSQEVQTTYRNLTYEIPEICFLTENSTKYIGQTVVSCINSYIFV